MTKTKRLRQPKVARADRFLAPPAREAKLAEMVHDIIAACGDEPKRC
jgi:hypothetical protein